MRVDEKKQELQLTPETEIQFRAEARVQAFESKQLAADKIVLTPEEREKLANPLVDRMKHTYQECSKSVVQARTEVVNLGRIGGRAIYPLSIAERETRYAVIQTEISQDAERLRAEAAANGRTVAQQLANEPQFLTRWYSEHHDGPNPQDLLPRIDDIETVYVSAIADAKKIAGTEYYLRLFNTAKKLAENLAFIENRESTTLWQQTATVMHDRLQYEPKQIAEQGVIALQNALNIEGRTPVHRLDRVRERQDVESAVDNLRAAFFNTRRTLMNVENLPGPMDIPRRVFIVGSTAIVIENKDEEQIERLKASIYNRVASIE